MWWRRRSKTHTHTHTQNNSVIVNHSTFGFFFFNNISILFFAVDCLNWHVEKHIITRYSDDETKKKKQTIIFCAYNDLYSLPYLSSAFVPFIGKWSHCHIFSIMVIRSICHHSRWFHTYIFCANSDNKWINKKFFSLSLWQDNTQDTETLMLWNVFVQHNLYHKWK